MIFQKTSALHIKSFFLFSLFLAFMSFVPSSLVGAQATSDCNVFSDPTCIKVTKPSADHLTVTVEITKTTQGTSYGPFTIDLRSKIATSSDPLSIPQIDISNSVSTPTIVNSPEYKTLTDFKYIAQSQIAKAKQSTQNEATIAMPVVFDNVANGDYVACINGSTQCTSTITIQNGAAPNDAKISITGSTASDITKKATSKQSSCNIDGIGWIVCPVVNFMAKIADGAFVFLSNNFLKTSSQIFTVTDSTGTNPTYSAWSTMRNIANVAFVIFFLIIIFSQVTSVGITNYGVKKMLPRLVIAAILVNLSYYVCQIAVDLSNILGYSLKDLLAGLVSNNANATAWSSENSTLWAGVAAGIVGITAGAAVVWGAVALLIPALIAGYYALWE